ncbi:MAG: GDSL-type esterase/lipase family protein [Chloroflexi bacterium]|nr:GDSL-type esterase/lipase family protein [Chloroflexota bacterium]
MATGAYYASGCFQGVVDMQWIALPSPDVEMRGLVGAPRALLHRIPEEHRDSLPAGTWERAEMTSGVRLVFQTDSPRVALHLEYLQRPSRASKVDAYVDGRFAGTDGGDDAGPCTADLLQGMTGTHDVELHMPPYSKVRLKSLGLAPGASLSAPTRRPSRFITFHGDSITHGAVTTRSGLAYPSRVARALGADFINLGFGGSARGEPGMARIVADLPADAISLYYGINTYAIGHPGPEEFGRIYADFLEVVRASHAETPIIVITPTWYVPELHQRNASGASVEEYREVIRHAVSARVAAGDANIAVLEGCSLIGPGDESHLADLVHPNYEGFAEIAGGLTRMIGQAWGIA